MRASLTDLLACPICREPLALVSPDRPDDDQVDDGRLRCSRSHEFRIAQGVARLLPTSATSPGNEPGTSAERSSAARSISETYDAMWSRSRPGDREWSNELEERVEAFPLEVRTDPADLVGKTVLDAGCGLGTLARAIVRFGCSAVGLDVSESVAAAVHGSSPEERAQTDFVQGDLMEHPFRDRVFDIVYAGGVLHLNPEPKAAFTALQRALKPGGVMYIWVYGKVHTRRHAARQMARNVLSRLPHRVRFSIISLWLPQAMLRQRLRTWRGTNDERDRLTTRERFTHLLDHYTPKYRWEFEQDEVRAWFVEAGFTDIEINAAGMGFGVTATLSTPDRSVASSPTRS